MRTRCSGFLLLFALLSPGCTLFTDGVHRLSAECHENLDRVLERHRSRQWAEAAWVQYCAKHPDLDYSRHFARGFKEGFAEQVYGGGNTEPPLVPPPSYRRHRYQTPDGYRAIEEWFAGYRQGAVMAQEGNYHRWVTGPSSLAAQSTFDPEALPPPHSEPRPEPLQRKPEPIPAPRRDKDKPTPKEQKNPPATIRRTNPEPGEGPNSPAPKSGPRPFPEMLPWPSLAEPPDVQIHDVGQVDGVRPTGVNVPAKQRSEREAVTTSTTGEQKGMRKKQNVHKTSLSGSPHSSSGMPPGDEESPPRVRIIRVTGDSTGIETTGQTEKPRSGLGASTGPRVGDGITLENPK